MNFDESTNEPNEEILRRELKQARDRADHLASELSAVDNELLELANDQRKFNLLQNACDTLDELDEMGGSRLFWNGELERLSPAAHLASLRGSLESFEKKIGEIEDRRLAVLDELDLAGANTDFLAGEILEVERLEEMKKLEWLIERPDADVPFRTSIMPWARGGEDDQLFRKSLALSLLLALLFGGLLPLIDLPIPEPGEVIEIPERFARLAREERPPPPPPEPQTIEEAKPRETEELVPTEELAETVEPQPQKVTPESKPSPGTGSKGILAFRDKFAGLAKTKATNRLGSKARISNSGQAASGAPQRSLVTSQVPGGSDGINLAALSRNVGGGGGQGFEGIEVVQATSTIGTGGGGSDRPLSGGHTAGRTDEEIQIVFDRYKSALYRLYNRELRNNPTLRGQMVLRMTIEPDGSVSVCELKSTDLKSPTLGSQVVARVKTFDFGAKEGIAAVSILYPIDFLPAM